MFTSASPTVKTWWGDLWQRAIVMAFVLVAVVVPVAFILTVSNQPQPELLWVAFVASIISAPLFLYWRERVNYEVQYRKEAAAFINVWDRTVFVMLIVFYFIMIFAAPDNLKKFFESFPLS